MCDSDGLVSEVKPIKNGGI